MRAADRVPQRAGILCRGASGITSSRLSRPLLLLHRCPRSASRTGAMSSVVKPAKKAKKTIDSFFAAKLSKPLAAGAQQPLQVNVEARCVAIDATGGASMSVAPQGPDAAPCISGDGSGCMEDGPVPAPQETGAAARSPRKRRAGEVGRPNDGDAAPAKRTGKVSAVAAAAVVETAADGPVSTSGTAQEQQQVAANRNRALARRAVAEASQPGAPPLRLSSLLVEPSWRQALAPQLGEGGGSGGGGTVSGSLAPLDEFLAVEWGPGRKPVYPPKEAVFAAFNACPFDQVRVVILGQDPYHGPGQAMGLSFSVPRDCRPLPPSLLNIYKEATADLGWETRPQHGDLTSWSVQGVLLLNTCLTVRQGEANSHSKRGWEAFTDAAIRALSVRRQGIVFLLWGKPAQAKAGLVDAKRHHVLSAAHPSPLSASRGFFGCRHFSQANQLLTAQGLPPIDWRPT